MSFFKKKENQIKDPLAQFRGTFATGKGLNRFSKSKAKGSTSTQMGHAIHGMVQSEFARQGKLAAAELPIVDSPNLMVSKLDVFTKDGKAIEIKTVSVSELSIMRSPRPDHKLQLIYYMNATNAKEGMVLYIAREAPGIRKAFKVDKNGEAEEMSSAAIRHMQLRRQPGEYNPNVAREKMFFSLESALKEQKSSSQHAKDYLSHAKEVRKLRRRELTSQKKAAFNRSYQQARKAISQQHLLDSDGMPHGGIAETLRKMLTAFGSEWQGKKWSPVDKNIKPERDRLQDDFISSQNNLEKLREKKDKLEKQIRNTTFEDRKAKLQKQLLLTKKQIVSQLRSLPEDIETLEKKQKKAARFARVQSNIDESLYKVFGFNSPYKEEIDNKIKDLRNKNLEKHQLRINLEKNLKLAREQAKDPATGKFVKEVFRSDFAENKFLAYKELQEMRARALGIEDGERALLRKDPRQPIINLLKEGREKEALDLFRKQAKVSRIFNTAAKRLSIDTVSETVQTGAKKEQQVVRRILPKMPEDLDRLPSKGVAAADQRSVTFSLLTEKQKKWHEFYGRPLKDLLESDKYTKEFMAKTIGVDVRGKETRILSWNNMLDILEESGERVQSPYAVKPPVEARKEAIPPSLPKRPDSLPPKKLYEKAAEITFDIENTIATRKDLSIPGRILQFHAKELTGKEMISAIGPKTLRQEELKEELLRKRSQGKVTAINTSLLNIQSAETAIKTLEDGSIKDLVKKGMMTQDDLVKISQMSSRVKGGLDASSFLKTELEQYLEGTTRIDQKTGKRVFLKAYGAKGQGKFLSTTEHIGDFFAHEERALKEAAKYFDSFQDKRVDLIGHNIQKHDIPMLQERARLYGIKMLENMDNATVVDTLLSGDKGMSRIDDLVREYQNLPDQVVETSHGKINRSTLTAARLQEKTHTKGFKALESFVQSFGLSTRDIARQYQHTAAIHDIFGNESMRLIMEKADKKDIFKAFENWQTMVLASEKGEKFDLARERLLIPEEHQVQTVTKDIVEGKTKELYKGETRAPSLRQTKIAPPKPSFIAESIDAIYGKGVSAEAQSIAKSSVQTINQVMSSIGPQLDDWGDNINKFLQDNKIIKRPIARGKSFMTLGLLGVAAGAGVLMASAPFQSSAPHRPIRINKPIRSMSADDEEHTLNRYEGAYSKQMRHSLTDFGSGYKGMKSIRAILESSQKTSNLSQRAGTFFQGSEEGISHFSIKATKSASQAANSAAIKKPLDGKSISPLKAPKEPVEVKLNTRASSNMQRASEQSEGMNLHNVADKIRIIERKTRFSKAGADASGLTFRLNHARKNHYRM